MAYNPENSASKISLLDRLWRNVERKSTDDCWLWNSSKHKDGYGMFTFGGKTLYAHRVSFELSKGKPPPGFFICHKCDNPPCCNPDHLYAGTAKRNSLDMTFRERGVAKLSITDVIKIKKSKLMKIPVYKIAKKFNVSISAVHFILSGHTFKEITPSFFDFSKIEISEDDFPKSTRSKTRIRKDSIENRIASLKAIQAGQTITQVSKKFGIHISLLSRYKNGKRGYSISELIEILEKGE